VKIKHFVQQYERMRVKSQTMDALVDFVEIFAISWKNGRNGGEEKSFFFSH
jgi:hypothetical protein